MGTLAGHLLPGSFFIIFGVWWSFVTSMRYVLLNKKSPYKKNEKIGYKSTVTMPCVCCPTSGLRRAPIESWIKLLFSFVGIMGEFITGFEYDTISSHNHEDMMKGNTESHELMHMHHHRRDIEMAATVETWHFAKNNVQHITMYSAFFLGKSIVRIKST